MTSELTTPLPSTTSELEQAKKALDQAKKAGALEAVDFVLRLVKARITDPHSLLAALLMKGHFQPAADLLPELDKLAGEFAQEIEAFKAPLSV